MPGPDFPDAPPPEVPEEFAAAYREAFRRALETDATDGLVDEPAASSVEHSQGSPPVVREPVTGWRSSRWFLPVVVAGGAIVLVVAAYGVGAALSGDGKPGSGDTASPSAARTHGPSAGHQASDKPSRAPASTAPGGWDGPVRPVTVDAISTDCTAPPSQDSAGNKVTYVPENAIDDLLQTAWRCTGTALGQKLTLRISGGADIAEVGIVPGYAKTDADSGADRYAENNRITRVRWTFGDGVSVVQRLDPDPSTRALQMLRVPRTTTDTVTVEILKVRRGPRDTTAISAIALFAAS